MEKVIISFSKFLKLNEAKYQMADRTQNKYNATDLIVAVENNNFEDVIEILTTEIGKDADYINAIENYHGQSALHIAVEQGNLKMVKLLLQFGADPNVLDESGETPLGIMSYLNYDKYEYDPRVKEEIANVLRNAGGSINPEGYII
jgi:hypothetical protein